MPKAIIALRETINKWRPPFGKTVTDSEITVEAGQAFDQIEHMKDPVFKLVRCDGDRVLIEHHRLFTLKGHEHPANRQVWVGKDQETSFTYLWGADGITKSLQLKEIVE
ncbi:MAG: hypothetical protein NTW59_00330 [Candidatus Diapherotrites archaeon]|nr:hypothetical protein [Candidatus Diapherotrites archaeon]